MDLEIPHSFISFTKKNTFGYCGQAINHHYPVKCYEHDLSAPVLGEWLVKGTEWTSRLTVLFLYIYTDPLDVKITKFTYDYTKKIYRVSVKILTNHVAIGWESWKHWLFWIGIYDTNGIVKQHNIFAKFDILIRPSRYGTFKVDTEVENFSTNMECKCKAVSVWNCNKKFEELVKMGLKECLKGHPKCDKAYELVADGRYYSFYDYLQSIVRNTSQIINYTYKVYEEFSLV